MKGAVELDTDNYPELRGKSVEETKAYIREHLWDMLPTPACVSDSGVPLYSSLGEQLADQDEVLDRWEEGEIVLDFNQEL